MRKISTALQLIIFSALTLPLLSQQSQPDAEPATAEQISLDLSHVLQKPFDFTQLKLQATMLSISAVDGDAEFKLQLDSAALSWQTNPDSDRACRLTVAIAALSADGKMLQYAIHDVDGTLPAARFNLAKAVMFKIKGPAPLKAATIRIAVRDFQSGRMGGTAVATGSAADSTVANTQQNMEPVFHGTMPGMSGSASAAIMMDNSNIRSK